MTSEMKFQRAIVLSSSVVFLLSLATPSLLVRGEAGFGVTYFLLGWLGPVGAEFAWFANPCIWIANSKIRSSDYREARAFAGLALALILSMWFRGTILVNEGGGRSQIAAFQVGYWLWAISALMLFVGSFWLSTKFRRNIAP
jgi:hypothetical protein